jgi:hypothetical protein
MNKKTFSLFSQPFLDTYTEKYKNIITINAIPQGPLASFVKRINTPKLSQFKTDNRDYSCCLALINKLSSNEASRELMVSDDIPDLISFLIENNYTIDTSLTKMLNQSDIKFKTDNASKLICFVTFNK